jgi:hypothetical protein
MKSVGFTGTQAGMTSAQHASLRIVLTVLAEIAEETAVEFHHGDCVGADVEAATYARGHGWRIIAHPSNIEAKSANYPSDIRYAPRPPIDRNHTIVDESDILVCGPRQSSEVMRSGTWATKRYAWKKGLPTLTVYPDGSVS